MEGEDATAFGVHARTHGRVTAPLCARGSPSNPWGHVRIGKVLEDLDALAGSVVLERASMRVCAHGAGRVAPPCVCVSAPPGTGGTGVSDCKTKEGLLPPRHVALVTASVDRICVERRHESLDVDMALEGCVTHVGRSSAQVGVQVDTRLTRPRHLHVWALCDAHEASGL